MKKPKTFLICPVRGHDMEETANIVNTLEMIGWEVHWPPRDTNQDDLIGFDICSQNLEAIRNSDIVHVFWDETSQGSKFDLGMAFALGKPIVVLSDLELTDHKSFQNMMKKWEEESDKILTELLKKVYW